MRRLETVLVLVLAASIACGQDAEIAADDVGTVCPTPVKGGRAVTLSALLGGGGAAPGQQWLRVRRQDQLKRDGDADSESRRRVRLTSREAVAGPSAASEESVVVLDRTSDEAKSELARGSAVVVVRPQVRTETARVVASVRSDGSVAFLGECAAQYLTAPYARFVATRHEGGDRRSGADLFYALATDPSLVTALREAESPAPPKPTSWEARAARDRVIDPEGTDPPPPAVMKTLKGHLLHFAYPAGWRSFEGSIVTFVPDVGWNAAMPLSIESDDPEVFGYVSLTAPLEIWLVPAPAGIDRPLARLAVIDAAALAQHDDVYFDAKVDATSLEDLARKANDGAVVFALRPKTR